MYGLVAWYLVPVQGRATGLAAHMAGRVRGEEVRTIDASRSAYLSKRRQPADMIADIAARFCKTTARPCNGYSYHIAGASILWRRQCAWQGRL